MHRDVLVTYIQASYAPVGFVSLFINAKFSSKTISNNLYFCHSILNHKLQSSESQLLNGGRPSSPLLFFLYLFEAFIVSEVYCEKRKKKKKGPQKIMRKIKGQMGKIRKFI